MSAPSEFFTNDELLSLLIEPDAQLPARAFPRFSSGDSRVRFVSPRRRCPRMARAHARPAQTAAASLKENVREGTSIRTNSAPRSRPSPRRPTTACGVPRARHRSPEFRRRVPASIRARARAAPCPRVRRVVVIARRNGPSDEPRALTSPTPPPTRRWRASSARRASVPPRSAPPRPLLARRAQGAADDRATRLPRRPSASTAPDPPSTPNRPDPETDWDALTLAADESGDAAARARTRTPHGVDLGVDPLDARTHPLVFPPPTPTLVDDDFAPGFELDRETNHDTRIATVSFRFRDVLIRSRALERLVEAAARRPAASTAESALLLELFRATTADDAAAYALGDGLTAPLPPSPRGTRRYNPRRRFRGHARRGGGEREARGGGGDARRGRTPTPNSNVWAEDVARDDTRAREIGRRWESEMNRIKTEVRFERHGGGGGRGRGRVADVRDYRRDAPRRRTHKTPRDTSTAPPRTAPPSAAPPRAHRSTAALASATRRALSLARRAFAAASTRREKCTLGGDRPSPPPTRPSPRAASETLAAKRDVAALSEESRARLRGGDARRRNGASRARAEDARRGDAAPTTNAPAAARLAS